MKKLFLAVCFASLAGGARAATICPPVSVAATVLVSAGDVFVADLIAPEGCPELLRGARLLRLGAAPLAGSDRVLDAETVRGLMRKAAAMAQIGLGELHVPERVTIRRVPAASPEAGRRLPRARAAGVRAGNFVVRPGELVRLLWDQDGIRSMGPATCLDRGGAGDKVRARIQPGGLVVTATVVNAGLVRISS